MHGFDLENYNNLKREIAAEIGPLMENNFAEDYEIEGAVENLACSINFKLHPEYAQAFIAAKEEFGKCVRGSFKDLSFGDSEYNWHRYEDGKRVCCGCGYSGREGLQISFYGERTWDFWGKAAEDLLRTFTSFEAACQGTRAD